LARFVLALALALGPGLARAQNAAAFKELWRRDTSYISAPTPLAFDINADRHLEIIQVGVTNEVSAMDPEAGKILWTTNLGDYQLFSPIAGHFLDNNRINVFIATRGSTCFILDGSTGHIDRQYTLPFTVLLMPTAFPWTDASDKKDPYREGILFYDPSAKLQGFLFNKNYSEPLFQLDTQGPLRAPAAVGRTGLSAPFPHAVFTTTDGLVTVFSLRQPGRAVTKKLEGDAPVNLGVTLADLNGDGLDDIVVADKNGYLHALSVNGNTMEPIWTVKDNKGKLVPRESVPILNEPDFPPVAIDVDHDGADDLLIPRSQRFGLINGKTGRPFWSPEAATYLEYQHDSSIQSPPAAFQAGGKALVAFCDEQNLSVLDLASRSLVGKLALGRTAVVTPMVGSLLANGQTQALARTNTDGCCVMIDLGMPWNDAYPPWTGPRANPTQSLRVDRAYQKYRIGQMAQLSKVIEDNLDKAKKLEYQGEWRSALDMLDDGVLATSPYHSEALKLRRYYFFRANLAWIASGALAALLTIGYLGWIAFRHGKAAAQWRLALRALEKNRPDRATDLLERLCRRFPKNRAYVAKLAGVYIQQRRFDEDSALVFERAYRMHPQEEAFLKALATAYSAEPRLDEQAAAVYQVMGKLSRKPGPWHFLLGQALQELSHGREALEAYRLAIVHQHEDPRLPGLMTDLYVELGICSPDILPTLERVLAERQDDSAFLRAFCRACQEARRYDAQAQQVADRLLELDPEAPSAHAILATRLLQEGRDQDAIQHAQQILQVTPNDPVGLRLLGACYAAEKRLDETAMDIFAKALEANPDAPEILIAVGHGYAQQGRLDHDARETYQKALAHYPQDEVVLEQLARIAKQEQDSELATRTIEPLLAMGRRSRDLVLQLAHAYCRLGVVEDRATDIYREALTLEPGQPAIQENLAAIFLRQKRADAEALHVYEAVLARHPDRFDVGLELLRCYGAADQIEKALALGEGLRRQHADNVDLQKMLAAISDKADQMESAIAGYEQALASHPDDVEAIVALASLYGRKQRNDNVAIEAYLKAIQARPGVIAPYMSATRAYAARGAWDHVLQTAKLILARCPDQLAQALGLLENLTESFPKRFDVRWFFVETLILSGRLRDALRQVVEIRKLDAGQAAPALAALDRLVDKSPGDAPTHLERGRVLIDLGQDSEARQALEKAHQLHPENETACRELMAFYQRRLDQRDSPDMRMQLGRLAMRAEKHDLAIACFQVTSRDYRWEGESLRNLARCFMAKGMLDLAMQDLRRLPLDADVKELLYDLGKRYEDEEDFQGAREAFKLIFAADITFHDVKTKLEVLAERQRNQASAERTAILQSMNEAATKRYDLQEEIGRGAMGIVYKARDRELEEVVALKILPDNLLRNPDALRRFRQEARNARRLSHPNIVRIHDIGEEQGRKYISMELVTGSDLKHKLRACNRKLPFADALRYSMQICEAMAYAHSIGIVHRDIKPANLMLTKDDQVKVTDFGIAKMIEQADGAESTKAGAVIGTPLYMSPEQVKGEQVDHRADIYSMGIVFYEMASGYPPFVEGDLSYQHLHVDPKPLAGVPDAFAAVVTKCLAKDPADRWQSATEIMEALKAVPA
jgi:tetratricopeptide (TPR) repeat protein/outer membrane protein assembly factor BamB